MADNYETMNQESPNYGCFKEAVCIDASRVYDSCGDKDCSLYKQPSPPKTERRAELYNEKESQITPTLSSIHPKTHTPITDIIIHQTDNMFKPGIMYANTLHSVFLPETKYLSIRK